MTDDDRKNLDRIVGGLEAKIDAFQQNWQEQDRRASEGRKFLYEKVEGFGHNVQMLSNQITMVVRDVAEMKPHVQDWVNSKNRAEGAGVAIKTLWAVGGAFLVGAGWLADHLLTWHVQ